MATPRFFNLLIKISHCLKWLDQIHRRILWKGENNRFDSFVHSNNQYSSSFSKHTYIKLKKEIQNKKHGTCNSKPKVLSNTMFHISRFPTMDIYSKTDRFHQ